MERDEEMIGKIILMEKHFWEENVLGGIEPVPDGPEATTNYFNSKFSHSNVFKGFMYQKLTKEK